MRQTERNEEEFVQTRNTSRERENGCVCCSWKTHVCVSRGDTDEQRKRKCSPRRLCMRTSQRMCCGRRTEGLRKSTYIYVYVTIILCICIRSCAYISANQERRVQERETSSRSSTRCSRRPTRCCRYLCARRAVLSPCSTRDLDVESNDP